MKQELIDTMTQWRRDIHQYPELAYKEYRTAELVARVLKNLDLEVHTQIADTGVVAVLEGARKGAPKLALRADMDALPIQEKTDLPYASKHDHVMHACGHDGHTAILLGAASELCKYKDQLGTIYFIFQPAEENEAGAKKMIEEGLFDRFPADVVFALHNAPGMPVGHIASCPGPMMAAFSTFECKIIGKPAHSSTPCQSVDSIEVASQLVQQFYQVGRRFYPSDQQPLICVSQIEGGQTYNVIAGEVTLKGSTRCLSKETQSTLARRLLQTAESVTSLYGARCEFTFQERYPVLVNDSQWVKFGMDVAKDSVGISQDNPALTPLLGSEDFAFMLEEKPGAYFAIGNGEGDFGGCQLHHPNYDFNDLVLPIGAKFWVDLSLRFFSDNPVSSEIE